MYIREAHPDSILHSMKDGQETLATIRQTNSLQGRTENARVCMATLKLTVPTVIDKEDNKVNAAYAGWPDRLYVVGRDGRIAYKGGPGPAGFKTGEVEEWLKKHTK